ncbi:peptidylprolyl isomerase [Malassezia vespertilionis]|uniref:peptidylprolyl isomerase n=1 Tax=Malassezia vespertilionis TaxID=2020962 RepID=UPI0024B20D5B|nr:peptidylprolyl isomerase [Malassezia vespertilionis]WFD04712.1 peptidylprolyl isomerase [Malassezia vespertilionis]
MAPGGGTESVEHASEPLLEGDAHANGANSPHAVHDDANEADEDKEYEAEQARRRDNASAAALTLEIVGDLPHADVKPPENVLFVCKLNPVTRSDDLELIFSRFGKIHKCEVMRDKATGDSLQYAFVEFEDRSAAEQAYYKMQNVLIDDRRIWVDFSQSVSKLHGVWVKQRTCNSSVAHGTPFDAPSRHGHAHVQQPPQGYHTERLLVDLDDMPRSQPMREPRVDRHGSSDRHRSQSDESHRSRHDKSHRSRYHERHRSRHGDRHDRVRYDPTRRDSRRERSPRRQPP